MILGIGVDAIEIARIQAILETHGERFETKVFTEQERAYCRRKAMPAPHYAARFAAKEAFFKAIGTGQASGLSWRDIGVESLASGMPRLVLTGRARDLARQRGVAHLHLSLSHSRDLAVAVVVLEGSPDAQK